ncbi:hypothetical protein RPSD_52390 (plasmid) [Ralstonia solanacearum]|nr:hypothetical protein RPSD_52390 [Ralstonia solanacearum]
MNRKTLVKTMKPYIVDAETVEQLVDAASYGVQASVEWAISRIVLLQNRVAEGQEVVIGRQGTTQSIKSRSELDAWVASALPNAWSVLCHRAH